MKANVYIKINCPFREDIASQSLFFNALQCSSGTFPSKNSSTVFSAPRKALLRGPRAPAVIKNMH